MSNLWNTAGTPEQQAWIAEVDAATTFPWDKLKPKLQAVTGKTQIPVVYSDLSRYGAALRMVVSSTGSQHQHIHDGEGNFAHALKPEDIGRSDSSRKAVWGLAWSNGKIEIERSLSKQNAQITFVCEAMHELDWFFMTDVQREAIWRAYHGTTGPVADHDSHGWFEERGNQRYQAWPGESLMIGGVRAFSPYQVSDQFDHRSTPEVVKVIREQLLPSADPTVKYLRGYKTAHKSGPGTHYEARWASLGERVVRLPRAQALAQGMALCRTCRP